MSIKKFFNRILGSIECPIPREYQDKLTHIFFCSGSCTKCYHWKDYQLESCRKESEEYILEQHKIITDLTQKFEDSNKLITPEQNELQELREINKQLRERCHMCGDTSDIEKCNLSVLKKCLNLESKLKQTEDESNKWKPIIARLIDKFGTYERAKAIDNETYLLNIHKELEQFHELEKEYKGKKSVLLNKLKAYSMHSDIEYAHAGADEALIKFIDDEEISDAFDEVDKWYA